MLSTGFFHRQVHYSDDPARDAAWVQQEAIKYGGTNSARWRREMEIDWNVYGGQRVWPMLSKTYHDTIINPDVNWTLFRVIDSGIRHPTVCLWGMINQNGDRHYYREMYSNDKSISLNCREILRLTPDNEQVQFNLIDPETKKRSRESLTPFIELYAENGITCEAADNSAAGYDRVTDGLLSTLARRALADGTMPKYLADMNINQDQLFVLASKPSLTFDMRFIVRCFNECENLRWRELSGDPSQKAEPEKVVDRDDDGPDCVRYGMQSAIFWKRPSMPSYPIGSERRRIQEKYYARLQKARRYGRAS